MISNLTLNFQVDFWFCPLNNSRTKHQTSSTYKLQNNWNQWTSTAIGIVTSKNSTLTSTPNIDGQSSSVHFKGPNTQKRNYNLLFDQSWQATDNISNHQVCKINLKFIITKSLTSPSSVLSRRLVNYSRSDKATLQSLLNYLNIPNKYQQTPPIIKNNQSLTRNPKSVEPSRRPIKCSTHQPKKEYNY